MTTRAGGKFDAKSVSVDELRQLMVEATQKAIDQKPELQSIINRHQLLKRVENTRTVETTVISFDEEYTVEATKFTMLTQNIKDEGCMRAVVSEYIHSEKFAAMHLADVLDTQEREMQR